MTNLMRWLLWAGIFIVPYICIWTGQVRTEFTDKHMVVLEILPIILVVLFGLYASGVVLYRTYTLKDCPQASKELHEEIQQAREDLTSKGFKFRED